MKRAALTLSFSPIHRRHIAMLIALLLVFALDSTDLNAAAVSPEPTGEVSDLDLEATNSVEGVVLAVSNEQLGLLQLGEDLTNHQVVVYVHCAATEMPMNPALVPGETVVIDYLALPGEPPLATCVRRKPAEAAPSKAEAVTGQMAAVALNPGRFPPSAPARPSTFDSPPQSNAVVTTALPPDSVSIPVEEPYPACPADGEAVDQDDRFSFGKVVNLTPQGFVIREYDFAKDADVEVTYCLLPETETGNLSPELPLQIGDDVVVDYRERNGQRFATTLVREVKQLDRFSFGRVLRLSREAITVREFDFIKEMDVDTVYPLLPETEYANVSEDNPLQMGDSVILVYEEAEGQRQLTSLIREEPQPATEVEPEAGTDRFSFWMAVASVLLSLRE